MLYFISDECFPFSGSAYLLHGELKDSDNNLTSHVLELFPVIIIQDNRKAPHTLFLNTLEKEKKRRALDTDSFELRTKT